MSLTLPDIDRIAHLARLELSFSESERMLTRLNGFFDIVEVMRAVDTTGVTPLASSGLSQVGTLDASQQALVLRSAEPESCLP